jgi:FMN phosphatase YigB (HAD superfamily)
MKVLFDFDDVLFHNTKQFKEIVFSTLEAHGVVREEAERAYTKSREGNNPFSLRRFLEDLIQGDVHETYELLMATCKTCVNTAILEEVFPLVEEKNRFIISSGDREFQLEKIERSGVAVSRSNIILVERSKQHVLEMLCKEYKDEVIIFVDDREHFIEEAKMCNMTNLKPFLFTMGEEKTLRNFILEHSER